jgi:hypothetical protein
VAARVKFSYETGPDGQSRPYLWLVLRVRQGATLKVRGLLDSGADVSLLDLEYARPLGVLEQDLQPVTTYGPSGPLEALRTTVAVDANLPGSVRPSVALHPVFVPRGMGARWGRDLMLGYAVAFDERARQFTLFIPDAGPLDGREPA